MREGEKVTVSIGDRLKSIFNRRTEIERPPMPEAKMVTVSTGVVFRIRDVPTMALQRVNEEHEGQKPGVPKVYYAAKEKDIDNPDDPDYIKAVDKWNDELIEKMMDAVFVLGLEVVGVPESFPTMGEQLWAKKLKVAGTEVATEPEARFVDWVKYCAAPKPEDLTALFMACSRNAGVTEDDVASAAKSFPSGEKRSTDTGL